MHPDGLVAQRFGSLPIRRQEQPRSPPATRPRSKPFGIVKVVSKLGEVAAASRHTYPSLPDPALDRGQARLEVLQTLLLGPPLSAGGISPDPTIPPTDRHGQPPLDHVGGAPQTCAGIQQVTPLALPLVIAGPRD